MKQYQQWVVHLVVVATVILAGFQTRLWAGETADQAPHGHVLKIHSITFEDIRNTILSFSLSKKKDITAFVHVNKNFGQIHMGSGEHYKIGDFEDVEKNQTMAINHNIFLDADHGKENGSYSVCFELKFIGTSCHSIKAEEVTNKEIHLKDKKGSFATIGYELQEANVEEITIDDLDQYDEVLLRLNSIQLSDDSASRYFSSEHHAMAFFLSSITKDRTWKYGWIGDRGIKEGTHKGSTLKPNKDGKISNLYLSMIIPATRTLAFSLNHTKYDSILNTTVVPWSKLISWSLDQVALDECLTSFSFSTDQKKKEKDSNTEKGSKTAYNFSIYGLNY